MRNASAAVVDRVVEHRRAIALARHDSEFDGLAILQIADRLGRSPATSKAYFHDPTGGRARAVKARYADLCRGCGASTASRKPARATRTCMTNPATRARSREAPSATLWACHSGARDRQTGARLAIGHRAHFCAQSPVIRGEIQGSEVVGDHRQKARFTGISCLPGLVARVIRVGEVPGSNPGAPI
jgi:hypothetical protein